MVALAGVLVMVFNSVEIPKELRTLKVTSFVCGSDAADGQCGTSNFIASFSADQNRTPVKLSNVSQHMIDAVIASEDRGYFVHTGVDPWGILRAVVRDVRGSASQQGGSTITQQYVKQVYTDGSQTITRKLKEAAIALKLERKYTKQEILERYLNEIYFGRGAYGVEAASRAYFRTHASDLDIGQSAFLAGLIRSPNTADPSGDPKEANRRRHTSLVAMKEEGKITAAEMELVEKTPVEQTTLARPKAGKGTYLSESFLEAGGQYPIEWVRRQLVDMPKVGEKVLYNQGIKIYTTLNPALQKAASDAVNSTLDEPGDPNAAVVSIDSAGQIVAMIAGQDFENQEVNLALGRGGGGTGRPAGSTMKPVALAAYVEAGYSIKSKIVGVKQIVFPKLNDGQPWDVHNFDDEDFPVTTVEEATWHSVNTAFAQITLKVKPKIVSEMAARLGITAKVNPVPAAVLGSDSVSVLDMATAYSTFSNHGTLIPPFIIRRVESASGKVLYDVNANDAHAPRPVIDPGVADTVTTALQGVVKKGTATGAALKQPVAGKTGTTNEHRDAWFVGYTCHLTAAVWMGYIGGENGAATPSMENLHGLKAVTGGSLPTEVWKKYMKVAAANDKPCDWKPVDFGKTVEEPDPAYMATTTTVPPPAVPGAVDAGATTTTLAPAPAAPTTAPAT
jgi:penicillin-binding protein 1A